ncbi:ankyrin repeat domain-containing protein [Endozoicomonas sp. ONNA2]|uniref:ankyrin repeat domain-containing protein n=1 Tax=Endozoicomonas sp. ONNA2 TaxID=2828741 RepID=UPI0021478CFF|nr:ankyrin repeat domain-containing protein [Endozoicomonas sp. ONNA2]
MIASGASNPLLPGNRSGATNGHSEQQSSHIRSCSWHRRKLDEWCLKFKGPDKALMQAAKHNNTQLISRIIDQNPSSMNLCLKNKNENPAIQAAVRGNNEALQLLINLGASPNTLLAGESYFPSRTFKAADYSPANFTSTTMGVLLGSQETNPNQPNQVMDIDRSISMTPTELVNTQVAAKNRSEISVLLASDARTRINTKIEFFRYGPFKQAFNIEFPPVLSFRTTSKASVPVSLIGQAILLNNADLARELLGRPNLDPGKPEGTAENLLTIFMHKLSNGMFFNLGNPLRQKIITSETFCRQILDSDSLIVKRQLLALLTMNFDSRDYQSSISEFNQLDMAQLNDRINHELSPPSYESAVQEA